MGFQDFCTHRNITLQTVIPGHHQSLGATERRHGHFRGILDHIIGNRKSNCLSHKEWKDFSAMTALHLNSQVQLYDGFTPGKRVFGRTPKLPIGTVGNPNFPDFMKPVTAPTTKTLSLLNTIFKYEKHLWKRILTEKMQLRLERRIRNFKTEEFCLCQTVFFWTARKLKSDKRWQGPGIIIARYGSTYALVHFRGAYLEV